MNTPRTEPQSAPVTMPEVQQPRHKQVERQGGQGVPYVRHYPQVRGGICEFCGVLDKNVASQHQYKLCPHYRGMQLVCGYCPTNKNPDDIIGHAVLNITDHPTDSSKLVICCDSYDCTRAHQARFRVSQS